MNWHRMLGCLALGILMCALTETGFVLAQDKIVKKDPKTNSTTTVSGKITTVNAGGVKLKLSIGMKEEAIPATNIVRIDFEEMPGTAKLDLNKIIAVEEGRDYAKALETYEKIAKLPELKTATNARRFIDFRIAMYKSYLSDGDEEKTKQAIAGLEKFLIENSNGWEFSFAARQLAKMHTDTANFGPALRTLEAMERNPDVSPEIKQEGSLGQIDLLFLSGDLDKVKGKVEAQLKDPKATTALKERLNVYLIGCEAATIDDAAKLPPIIKKLEDIIAKTPDNGLKALAYNVMGDCQMAKGATRAAMWSYLTVETVFNQDRLEVNKALARLVRLFTNEKNEDRAKQYREKLARSR